MVGHSEYADMLSIPYVTPSGVVYIKFRNLADGEDRRYLNLGGEATRVYNVNALHNSSDTIAICEGELDTLILNDVVGIPAVGIVGSQAWKKHYPRLLEGYGRVWIFADNDDKADRNPGHELAKRIIRDLPQAVMVGLPRGMDVTDAYLAKGADYLRSLVEENQVT